MARILVIDDDPAVRSTIQAVLEREGHEVDCAADGDFGLRAFKSGSPQLVITDIIMPLSEGIETIRAIRNGDKTTPIIAMSGGARIGHADFLEMALLLGANATLAKPFERYELTAVVQRLLPA